MSKIVEVNVLDNLIEFIVLEGNIIKLIEHLNCYIDNSTKDSVVKFSYNISIIEESINYLSIKEVITLVHLLEDKLVDIIIRVSPSLNRKLSSVLSRNIAY
jgi:hypothetical protein